MSSGDASCARTRGWIWDYKKLQRPDSKSSSSDEDMSFNFDDSGRSEQSSDGGYASEKDLGKDLSTLQVSISFNAMEPNTTRENDAHTVSLNGFPASSISRDTPAAPLSEAKEKTSKHKDEHRRREKEKDHEKRSKRKEKSRDKPSSRDSKRKKEDADDKKSHERHRRSEKLQRFDDGNFPKKEKHWGRDDERKERHRMGASDREQFRSSRHDAADEFADHEMHRRERHWDSSRSSYHSKSEREKEGKRARLDEEQRVTNRARSPSPRASKGGKSPSPCDKDKDENDWTGREDKDGSMRYRRSGLGGYSPRRRRSDAAIRTPSPPARSPERRKPRAWDLPPAGMDSGVAAAMAAAHQAAAQQAAALASVSSLVTVNPALAAVSLTQATRNFRRLYIGNVPASVSDGELLEFINAAMLSVHAYHLPGTKPCINCMVNVEKSYAFAEFLTPEDATAGLAFDGITLHGTTLKIRRPRDYIPPPENGFRESLLWCRMGESVLLSVLGMVSNAVPDSPRKIFVGGICKTLTAEKVKEIVTAFGQLKAYHWEVTLKNNQMEAFAFLEYLDPSVTPKACAGLNGIRLGNKVLVVVQATPNASSEPDEQKAPFYGIPEHAKTLLQAPTRILEFQNVISKAEIFSLSEAELLEIEQDVRTECARFGTVKSSHVVKPEGRPDQSTEEANLGDGGSAEKLMLQGEEAYISDVDKKIAEYIVSVGGHYFQNGADPAGAASGASQMEAKAISSQLSSASNVSFDEVKEVLPVLSEGEGASLGVDAPSSPGTFAEDKDINKEFNDCTEQPLAELEETSQPGSGEKAMDLEENGVPVAEQSSGDPSKPIGETGGSGSLLADSDMLEAAADAVESLNSQIGDSDLGRVYVEFTREECACKAAHTLHGRLYGDRCISVAYFPLKLYQKRFKKGLEPRTHEERQILALAAQEHLNSFIPDRD